jgi:hypothetical protein
MKIGNIIKAGTLLFALSVTHLEAEVVLTSDRDTIVALGDEIAGMRDMLKNYIMSAIDLKYKDPNRRLDENIEQFESTIEAVRQKYSDTEVVDALATIDKTWSTFKGKLLLGKEKKVSKEQMKEGALYIHDNTRTIVKALMLMKRYFIQKSSIKEIKVYSASRNIGVSARGFGSHYMLKMWEVNDPTIKEHWDNKVAKKLLASLVVIKASSYGTNPRVKAILKTVERDYRYLDHLFYGMEGNYMPSLVDKKTNEMYRLSLELSEIILKKNQ